MKLSNRKEDLRRAADWGPQGVVVTDSIARAGDVQMARIAECVIARWRSERRKRPTAITARSNPALLQRGSSSKASRRRSTRGAFRPSGRPARTWWSRRTSSPTATTCWRRCCCGGSAARRSGARRRWRRSATTAGAPRFRPRSSSPTYEFTVEGWVDRCATLAARARQEDRRRARTSPSERARREAACRDRRAGRSDGAPATTACCRVDRRARARAVRRVVRDVPALGRHRSRRAAPRSRKPSALLPYVAAMGFDVLYLPPIHPIGRSFRKGREQLADAGARRSRQPVGDRRRGGRPHGDRARARHARRLRSLRRSAARRTGSRSRSTSRSRLARSSLGARASRVVPPSSRRHDQVRREPAEEIPGHLSVRLRVGGLAGALDAS